MFSFKYLNIFNIFIVVVSVCLSINSIILLIFFYEMMFILLRGRIFCFFLMPAVLIGHCDFTLLNVGFACFSSKKRTSLCQEVKLPEDQLLPFEPLFLRFIRAG